MPNIRDINLGNIRIQTIPEPPSWITSSPPQAIPVYPPVTSEIGTPIVNLPGCVESHRDSSQNTTLKEEDKDTIFYLFLGLKTCTLLQSDISVEESKQILNKT